MLKLRSIYDGRQIYKTSYERHKAFLTYDSLAGTVIDKQTDSNTVNRKMDVRLSEIVFVNWLK